MLIDEHFFNCPYCGESISMLLDLSKAKQSYIEDCEVCCNPIKIQFELENGNLMIFDATSIEQ